jgi:hypothetical protein
VKGFTLQLLPDTETLNRLLMEMFGTNKSVSTELFDESLLEQDLPLFPEGDGLGVRFGVNVGFGW